MRKLLQLLGYLVSAVAGGSSLRLSRIFTLARLSALIPTDQAVEGDSDNAVIPVSSQSELLDALVSGNTITLSNDIFLIDTGSNSGGKTGISIVGITGLTIDGKGFKLDGQKTARCLFIGDQSDVTFINLSITGGLVVRSTIHFKSRICLIYFHGAC